MKSALLTLITTAVLFIPAENFAADATKATKGELDKKDQTFVTAATQGGLFEVAAGQMAEKKAMSPTAKQLGAMMVKDHSAANMELEKIARAKGVMKPMVLDRKHSEMVEKLGKKEGADFDTALIDELDKAHKVDIAAFELETREGTDPELKAFAAKTLPILQTHETHVRQAKEGGKVSER